MHHLRGEVNLLHERSDPRSLRLMLFLERGIADALFAFIPTLALMLSFSVLTLFYE